MPWISYGARRALDRALHPGSRVLEFGAGGSTIYFASRASQVVTVEHDRLWAATVANRVGSSVQILVEPPTLESPAQYVSTDRRYSGMSFRGYAHAADDFPDGFFDVVLIDGRARPSVFANVRRKLKDGGLLLLDDSERDEYAAILATASGLGWTARRYYGPHPYVEQFGETTIWVSRSGGSEPQAIEAHLRQGAEVD